MELYYMDPPYADTMGYSKNSKNVFDHEEFYNHCRVKVKEGNIVLISEYHMPDDFVCIFEKAQKNGMQRTNKEDKVERLFIHDSQLELYKRSFPDEV